METGRVYGDAERVFVKLGAYFLLFGHVIPHSYSPISTTRDYDRLTDTYIKPSYGTIVKACDEMWPVAFLPWVVGVKSCDLDLGVVQCDY